MTFMLGMLDMQMCMMDKNKGQYMFYRNPNKYTMMANSAVPDRLDCFTHLLTDFQG